MNKTGAGTEIKQKGKYHNIDHCENIHNQKGWQQGLNENSHLGTKKIGYFIIKVVLR